MTPLVTVRTVDALRDLVAGWRRADETVALVPTMGALHDGHVSLIGLARAQARRVVASIFVNPTQFGPAEDFSAYPRHEADDAATLAAAGTDALYAPETGEMYPEGFVATVTVPGLSEGLCGASRPGHFQGVATVVTKLLLQCGPDVAIFGEKDYQQLLVIRRLVRDLDIPVQILSGPTQREPDGLALSSRNAYLAPADRALAPMLHRSLSAAGRRIAAGEPVQTVLAEERAKLECAGFAVEYLELRDDATLVPVAGAPSAPARVLAAVRLGKTRLIDNVPVSST